MDRDDTSTDNGQILVVSRSTRTDITNPKNSTKGQMDVAGWLLEDESGHSVKVTYIAQLDVKETLKPFVSKILIAEMARAPREVVSFVSDSGYAPFFVRWGDGPAQLIGDGDGDLKNGTSVFKINGSGEGTMSNGQQKCWLQYSDRMYERGINVVVEPKGVCGVSRVEGLARTLEITWTEAVKDEGARIVISRARGDGADDVYLSGKFLDKTVAMETPVNGTGAGMGRKKAPKREIVEAAAAVPVAAVMAQKLSNGYTAEKPKVRPLPAFDDQADNPKALSNGYTSPSVVSTPTRSAPVAAAVAAPVAAPAQAVAVAGGKVIPEDACIIISPDLYFTRSQCKFIGAILVVAFLWGKIA